MEITVVERKSTKSRKATSKSKSLSKYKKELDAVFSKYIRTKYPKKCFTCGKEGMLQNGHFIVRKYLFTRWEEDNCRPQCVGCNIYGKGMAIDFEERLKAELGNERVEEMKASRKNSLKADLAFYLEKIEHYTEAVDKLQNP